MNSSFVTRSLKKSEIDKLKNFAPADWHFELDNFFHTHYGKKYFLPIVTVKKGEIVAVANAIINGTIGWAGNIIVAPPFQGQGLGYAITKQLIEMMLKRVESILLIATKMGEGLYKKFGFKTIESYSFSESKKLELTTSKNISRFKKKQLEAVFNLDFENTSENRKELLKPFLDNAWVYASETGKIEGFYIQDVGDGPIIASNEKAGKALMEFKHSNAHTRSVIPASNKTAIGHLHEMGIEIKSHANRMILGKETNWKPKNIYSRLAGYCG